jgi:uncharacterized SAM-binding protein YcdF (DUF218 family)
LHSASIAVLGLFALISIVAIAVSREFWLPQAGRFLIVEDQLQAADAIVPLAGERARVFSAAELFGLGYADWFVLTEMWVAKPNPTVSYIDSVLEQATRAGVTRDRIVVAPGVATTTYDEVLNIRELAREQGWSSVIAVTSPFHSLRAKLILNDLLTSEGIRVTVQPIPDHWYEAEHWWRTRIGRQSTASEYLKLMMYAIGYHKIVGDQ